MAGNSWSQQLAHLHNCMRLDIFGKLLEHRAATLRSLVIYLTKPISRHDPYVDGQ